MKLPTETENLFSALWHAHFSLKAVARVTSLLSPYAPASASIMYPPYGLQHGGVILHRGLPGEEAKGVRAYDRHPGKSKKMEIKRQKREIEVKGRRTKRESAPLIYCGVRREASCG